jgi:putative hydrolase of the HAD superfamily
MRVVGAGRDRHPFHHHGNHSRVIAQDGRFLASAPGEGADLSTEVFTITTVPGKTTDAIFEWTGKDVGFDIYGTLVVSGSGDIGITDASQKESALRSILADLDFPPFSPEHSITDRFVELIRASHKESQQQGIPHPEVEVRELWASLLQEFHPDAGTTPEQIESLAVAYELATNPVWPMPGAQEILASLQKPGLSLGIVSNAQFYTPLLFEAFFDSNLTKLGFNPDLRFFSFEHRRGKPGTWLYEQLRDALAALDITPEETLYVGNDALKDVHAAATVGFKTALFAGDQRSLRWRKNESNLLPPNAILTDLRQILEIVA